MIEFREHLLRKLLGADQNLPDLADDRLQKLQVALLGSDRALPVPLIDVGGVVVVKEIILSDGPHVGADSLTGATFELLKATRFHVVAACTSWALTGCLSRSFEI